MQKTAQLVTSRLESTKQARDNTVMSREGKQLIAGRVRAFLADCAPGVDRDPDYEAHIADTK